MIEARKPVSSLISSHSVRLSSEHVEGVRKGLSRADTCLGESCLDFCAGRLADDCVLDPAHQRNVPVQRWLALQTDYDGLGRIVPFIKGHPAAGKIQKVLLQAIGVLSTGAGESCSGREWLQHVVPVPGGIRWRQPREQAIELGFELVRAPSGERIIEDDVHVPRVLMAHVLQQGVEGLGQVQVNPVFGDGGMQHRIE